MTVYVNGSELIMTVSQAHSHAIIDSQSVKSAVMVSQAVGYDAGKHLKGRKRFVTVDTLGLVLRVLITAANVGERVRVSVPKA
jgi:hypothetical protein